MHYFSNKFSKIAKSLGALCPQCPFLWPEIAWFAQICVFQTDHDKIELKNISYDVILVTSSLLRHQSTSPK